MSSRYTGQELAVGRRSDGAWVIAYAITARSARSHNRLLVEQHAEITVATLDQARAVDAHALYPALHFTRDAVVVGNGAHVTDLGNALGSGRDWRRALAAHRYVPGAPYTPRIAAVLRFHDHAPRITLAKVRRVADTALTSHAFYEYADIPTGMAISLPSYDARGERDGEPRDHDGDPTLLPIADDLEEHGEALWQRLDPQLRVAALVQLFAPNGQPGALWLKNAHAQLAEQAAE